jgi:hypothetical protein
MRRSLVLVAVFLAAFTVSLSAQAPRPTRSKRNAPKTAPPAADTSGPSAFTEKTTQITPPEKVMVYAFSPRSDRIAFIIHKVGLKKAVVIDGHESPEYDEIRPLGGKQSVLFSDDSKHFAYAARRDTTWLVVTDGKEGPAMQSVEDPSFSPDGSTVAYASMKDGKPVLVIDSASAPAVHDLPGFTPVQRGVNSPLALSPDLHHWAYVAGPAGSPDHSVVIDGKSSEKFSDAAKPAFSPDSAHCAFLAKTAKPTGDPDEWVVLDGKKVGPFHNLSGLVFSPDSKHYAAIRGGVTGPVFPGTPQLHAAIVRDGAVTGEFEAILPPLVFSPDSSRLAFIADAGTRRYCVIDGKAEPGFQNVHAPTFSPDSRHFAYAAEQTHGITVILDGRPGPSVNDVTNDFALVFSPDSSHLAYTATMNDGTRVPMLDNKPVGTPSKAIAPDLSFSPDSNHLLAQDREKIWIDGLPVKQDRKSASPAVFDTPTHLHTLITRVEKINNWNVQTFYRLDVDLPPSKAAP